MKLNTRGIENILELARHNKLKVFAPSTIAVFGDSSPKDQTPDTTIMRPSTIYGVTKVYLELLGEYYVRKYGVDFRSVRYPGIISNVGMPGGGTTDYACAIYHEAITHGKYTCFLKEDSAMPMMYMPDCLDAVIDLMEAPEEKLTQRTYNVTGFSFTPKEVHEAIAKHIPGFETKYEPDYRQAIADSWPRSLDDSIARKDWGQKKIKGGDRVKDGSIDGIISQLPSTHFISGVYFFWCSLLLLGWNPKFNLDTMSVHDSNPLPGSHLPLQFNHLTIALFQLY